MCHNIFSCLRNRYALNSTYSGLAAAYPTYYGAGRQQYLIRASELTGLGFTGGDLTSIGFNVAGTTGNPSTLNGYTIKIAETTTTDIVSNFLTASFTTVVGPANYTPAINSVNTHTFLSPYTWDGTSNLLIDICFYNGVTGVTAYQTYQTSTSFVSTVYYQRDGTAGSTACISTTVTNPGSIRPNMFLTKTSNTATATSNSIVMNVSSSLPASVSITQTTGTNPQCAGASATFTAVPTNGGTTPSYQWKVNGTNVGTNSTTYTTTT